MTSSLLRKNGNVFYIKSSYATYSTVWTYIDGKIKIYRLVNGKVSMQNEFPDKRISDYKIPVIPDKEVKNCYELDGDILGFKINENDQLLQKDFPVNIQCFTNEKFSSLFLNKLVEDISSYKLEDISEKVKKAKSTN